MIPIRVDYASPSALESTRERSELALAANARRPVRFHGRVVRELFTLRVAMRALGEAIWSDDSWSSSGAILDPVITVHPDRVFFEAFSQDQSAYALLIVEPSIFEVEGEVRTGTTNVDFSAWLWGALGEMRSSRETHMRIDAGGFEVKTTNAGGRFEQKVELPDEWVRGFLQLQAAMGLPGTRVSVRPVDLLSAIRFMRHTKAKVSPRGLRYEFDPGKDARIVLEPWEHEVPLVGATHTYAERRVIRTWGRRRLKLIEPLLPFAERVDIYLKGRALPSFYAVKLPGMTFVLGLSGWTANRWTGSSGFDLLMDAGTSPGIAAEAEALHLLRKTHSASVKALAEASGLALPVAARAMQVLCRDGMAIYDLESREYRWRELFETKPPREQLFPPDPRQEAVEALLASGGVTVSRCEPEAQRKTKHYKDPRTGETVTRDVIYRNWRVVGSTHTGPEPQPEVQAVVNDEGRVIFGQCGCGFFRENLLNLGPCMHIAALYRASDAKRVDMPVSEPGEAVRVQRDEDGAEEAERDDEEDADEDR